MSIHSLTGPIQLHDARLRAVCDLSVPAARQDAGLHAYDGAIQDLSPGGVKAGLAALAATESGAPLDDHDEAQIAAAVTAVAARLGELELHRVNPVWHIGNLDLSVYDREYAPADVRQAARDQHVQLWPDAVDAAIESLDHMPRAVAQAALPLARGLASFLAPGEDAARRAQQRFVDHLETSAQHGDPTPGMGAGALQSLLATSEACEVDLEELATRAEAEDERLAALLEEACRRLDPEAPIAVTVAALRALHPTADVLVPTVKTMVREAITWTAESGLVPYSDGECEVALMPESQRWAAAGMFAAAPFEPDAPSRFYVTPPDPALAAADQDAWLASYFNRATLPVIAVHEVSPGHFAHSRARRRATGEARRTLVSDGFNEGWAHYTEQLCLEEGFHADDPAFAIGVALDALRRVARLRCALALHAEEVSLDQAADLFTRNAHVSGPAARSETRRGLLDPGYGRYTWGKLAILDLRERARQSWGPRFTLTRFHRALLDLGSPPLGLIDAAIELG
ncbi:MAG: DUF885 domain-containing protein [Pseudonocardiales bacterium]|nr:MAG: DUF885 domain-containing protein [Pseudonocardiales bacterium]